MSSKRKKTNKNENKLRYITYALSILILVYVFVSDFSGYNGKLLYIPLEILLVLLIFSDYIIIKRKKKERFDFIILFINSLLIGYILSIEIILLPLTIRSTSGSFLYKQIHTYMVNHQMTIIPILLVLGGAFVIPGIKELYNKKKSAIYITLLTIGIILLLFGSFYTKICDLIYNYI